MPRTFEPGLSYSFLTFQEISFPPAIRMLALVFAWHGLKGWLFFSSPSQPKRFPPAFFFLIWLEIWLSLRST